MSNYALVFAMNDEKSKSFLDDLATSKALIPQIKRIAINRLNGSDSNLNLFLSNWVPQNLTFLSINWPWIDGKLITKMNFYSSSLTTSLKKVTKEIFLQLFEIDESDLEAVIKASCNSERLVLYWCDLKWSRAMDFKCSSTYKITVFLPKPRPPGAGFKNFVDSKNPAPYSSTQFTKNSKITNKF